VSVDSTGDAITDAMVRRSLEGLEDITVSDHVQLTGEALAAIARHLAGVPGRKNLIWISGSFPTFINTNGGERNESIVSGNRVLYVEGRWGASEKLDITSLARIDFLETSSK